ncbi:MAG: UDP-N-acetylmuramoyl-L-alanine--D-glutamate ligase [Desulfobulbaceae bacterium]|uniref:UDP-N-acetylmuramoylalanine--D-glutamate ligase n=1 Tax=Candidatus Desulfatifera sulfidica TaxID=2841691 RepID=A0A8J6TDF9_9BACT|nr:UDP-N-acetylmuramoyl-L-alanine--D-glutamate ligase [Candidatus Desulfatifera sulfidica]
MTVDLKNIQPKTVAVIGLGVSGRGAVRYFSRLGSRVLVSDSRAPQDVAADELAFLTEYGVETEFAGHDLTFLAQADLVIVSPGVPFHLPVLNELRGRGIPVLGELAVVTPLITVPIVAITGTNGKTTVTELITALLQTAGRKVFVGGNIGRSLFDYLVDEEQADCLVLEVSSFQLEAAGSFCPRVALLLNITPDHLDRHGDMAGYMAAKMQIFAHQKDGDVAIVSADDARCRQLLTQIQTADLQLFGHGSDCMAYVAENDVVHIGGENQEDYQLSGTRLAGKTGLLNMSAAILAARSLGCEPADIRRGLAAFAPGAHRLARVAEVNGVVYYDDSKATNTGAVLAALDNFSSGVILIAGGRDKGDDYTLLQPAMSGKVRLLILIGEAAGQIFAAVGGQVETKFADSMQQAVKFAAELAQAGDTVLLSPACASFDMYDSYAHRGRAFQDAVKEVAGYRTESVLAVAAGAK